MSYIDTGAIGNRPAWRIFLFAVGMAALAYAWAYAAATPSEPPADYRDDSTDAQIVTFPRVVR